MSALERTEPPRQAAQAVNLADTRGLLHWVVLAYSAFVVYGSLVPFDFTAVPWDQALARFRAIPMLTIGVTSRADWVANVLLFIPLAFLWMAVFTPARHVPGPPPRAPILGLMVLLACFVLSLGIEFTQIFFPPRTVSRNDILAETLGAIIGIAAWWLAGGKVIAWLENWRRTHGGTGVAAKLLWSYLLILLGYNVLPLDLTVSPIELFHKWREGKLQLIPFMGMASDPARVVYDLVLDVLIWTPVTLLWIKARRKPPMTAWRDTVLLAALLEFMQLFVYSRYTNTTDIFAAALGGAIGVGLASRLPSLAGQATRPGKGGLSGRGGLLLALAWTLLILVVFWYPYNFNWDRAVLDSHLEQLSQVPFTAFYFGTEYRAATEFLHKFGFFVPLGVFVALGRRREQNWRLRSWYGPLALLLSVVTALLAESGKLFLPDKTLDSANLFLEISGGIGGYWVTRNLLTQAAKPAVAVGSGARVTVTESAPIALPLARKGVGVVSHAIILIPLLALGFWSLGRLPGVPYNVVELFAEGPAWWTGLLLALFVYWWAVPPVRLARAAADTPALLWRAPLFVLGHGVLGYCLLRLAVPEESLGDIVGAPVLAWSWEFESLFRFVALNGVLVILLMLAAHAVSAVASRQGGKWLPLVLLPWLLVGYWVVVPGAATDNIVELLAPRMWAHVFVAVFLLALFFSAGILAARPTAEWVWLLPLTLVASFAVTVVCLRLGLNWHLDKYGQRFSALQFLLSPDRDHYLGGAELWVRLGIAYLLALVSLLVLQWPHYRARFEARRLHRRHRIRRARDSAKAAR